MKKDIIIMDTKYATKKKGFIYDSQSMGFDNSYFFCRLNEKQRTIRIVIADGDERRLTEFFFCCKLFYTLLKRGRRHEKEA